MDIQDDVRNGVKFSLESKFRLYSQNPQFTSKIIEKKLHESSANQEDYIYNYLYLLAVIDIQIGKFPDEVVGLLCANGANPFDFFDAVQETDPREITRRLFIKCLMKVPELKENRTLIESISRSLELSCYNKSIEISQRSEDVFYRGWSSPVFVGIYSERCGNIANLLGSEISSLAHDIYNGKISPSDVGRMTEKELCPQSTQKERDEINKRLKQNIKEKTSDLFTCPKCKSKQCTYRMVQRRNLDEAPDCICYCLVCKTVFKGH